MHFHQTIREVFSTLFCKLGNAKLICKAPLTRRASRPPAPFTEYRLRDRENGRVHGFMVLQVDVTPAAELLDIDLSSAGRYIKRQHFRWYWPADTGSSRSSVIDRKRTFVDETLGVSAHVLDRRSIEAPAKLHARSRGGVVRSIERGVRSGIDGSTFHVWVVRVWTLFFLFSKSKW